MKAWLCLCPRGKLRSMVSSGLHMLVASFDLCHYLVKMLDRLWFPHPTHVRAEGQSTPMKRCITILGYGSHSESLMEIMEIKGLQDISVAWRECDIVWFPSQTLRFSVDGRSPSSWVRHYHWYKWCITRDRTCFSPTSQDPLCLNAKFAKLPLRVVETAYVKHVAWS
jgi:hypothetical protein